MHVKVTIDRGVEHNVCLDSDADDGVTGDRYLACGEFVVGPIQRAPTRITSSLFWKFLGKY